MKIRSKLHFKGKILVDLHLASPPEDLTRSYQATSKPSQNKISRIRTPIMANRLKARRKSKKLLTLFGVTTSVKN
jgi:hypothetical protein